MKHDKNASQVVFMCACFAVLEAPAEVWCIYTFRFNCQKHQPPQGCGNLKEQCFCYNMLCKPPFQMLS